MIDNPASVQTVAMGGARLAGTVRWPRGRFTVPAVALMLSAAWWVIAAVSVVAASGVARPPRPVPVVVLLLLFTVTQSFVLNVQIGREARSIYVSEIPTVVALLSISPAALVAVRGVSALVSFGLIRRQYRHPHKLVFNVSLACAEAGVAALTFTALATSAARVPGVWLAAVVAAAAASAFTSVGVGLVIGLVESTPRPRALASDAAVGTIRAVPVAAVGIIAWAAWEQTAWAAVPLAVVTVVLLGAYRGYAALQERHLALERLYRFSQVVTHAPGVDEVVGQALEQARDILHAEQARMTFVPDLDGGTGIEVVLRSNGTVTRGEPRYLPNVPWVLTGVVAEQQPVLVPRATKDALHREWLADTGLRDSIMVPVVGEVGPVGVLAVDNRIGDARGFDAADVRVLETIANQAAVALRNGQLLDQLRHESLHDPLTGLPNRAWLQRHLDELLDSQTMSPFAIGILDIDAFKDVNDTLGHPEGDRLLSEIAARMVTAADGVAAVARLGGDEFALVAPGCASPAAAERIGATILRAFREPVLLSGIAVDVSASVGLSLAPRDGTTAGTLLKRADVAMYDAKHNSSGLRVFDVSLDTASPSKLALVAQLRQAIHGHDIDVHVQPKVDASTGRLTGVEALARWRTPTRGDVSPVEFVPLAERSGLIRPLTRYVLEVAIRACAGWQAVSPGAGVAVNISVRSLADGDLIRLVDACLRRHRLPPQLLTLEITESHLMADPEHTLTVLETLRDAGVRLSIDDFGTGYSSLSYLRRLPVHEVKIDRSFVQGVVAEPEDAAIVRSIVELARALQLTVVAEGVEDEATWRALIDLGVHQIQGWAVSRAMPHHQLAQWAVVHNALPRQSPYHSARVGRVGLEPTTKGL